MNSFLRFVFTLAFALTAAATVSAATFNVNTTADTQDAAPGNGACADSNGNCSLRAAITESNVLSGTDIINVPAGSYTQSNQATSNEDNNVNGDWDILDSVVIHGQPILDPQNPSLVVLQAANTPTGGVERVLHIVNTTALVTINSVLVRFGRMTGPTDNGSVGGGIRNQGRLTLNDSGVYANTALRGGGIYNEGSIALTNVPVQDNVCESISGSCSGGGMYSSLSSPGTIEIYNSYFINNRANGGGSSFGSGGGMYVTGTVAYQLTIGDSMFSGNQANGGTGGSSAGGLFINSGLSATANITNTTFQSNSVSSGGTVIAAGIFMRTDLAGTLTANLDRVRVINNSAPSSTGTGMYVFSHGDKITLGVSNSTFSGNSGATGGGIYMTNSAASNISGVFANFTNTTFSGNTATANGGALYITRVASSSPMMVDFNYCTIANNTGTTNGGGIFSSTGTEIDLLSSVIAGNSSSGAPDISGPVFSKDYNHIGNTTGAVISGLTTNNSTGDPQLGPLAVNGEATQTHRPNTGSPVINVIPNGVNGCGTTYTTDQRGLPRPNDGTSCDKGSVEVNSGPFTISGTVRTDSGLPICNAVVVLSGGNLPTPLYYPTNNFGLYQFPGVAPGQYSVSISSKRYTFADHQINLQQDEMVIDFSGTPQNRAAMNFQFLPNGSLLIKGQ